MPNRSNLLTALLLAAAVLGPPAWAHDDAKLATLKAPHGGQLKVAGDWHLELVQHKGAKAGEQTLVVYVTDHDGRPQPTQGMNASAILLVGKAKQALALRPDGDNRLKGEAAYDAGAAPKLIVSVSGGGKTEQARFAP